MTFLVTFFGSLDMCIEKQLWYSHGKNVVSLREWREKKKTVTFLATRHREKVELHGLFADFPGNYFHVKITPVTLLLIATNDTYFCKRKGLTQVL